MKLDRSEAFYILSNLDTFINRFETATHKKVTPGALQIIHEVLSSSSFPQGSYSENLH
ncbi:MAG: hypothetical protein HQM10_14780 [Candidatus Riflebacteria bacterium]|nr:hypothetical protein [Candidatus Riflebacteria bacterium]